MVSPDRIHILTPPIWQIWNRWWGSEFARIEVHEKIGYPVDVMANSWKNSLNFVNFITQAMLQLIDMDLSGVQRLLLERMLALQYKQTLVTTICCRYWEETMNYQQFFAEKT